MLSRPPDIPSYLVASAVKIPLTMIDQGSPLTERALFVTGNIVTSLHSSTTLVLVLNLLTLHNVDPLIGKRIVLLSLVGVCTYVCTNYGMYNNMFTLDRNRFGKQNARELWYGTTDRGGRRSHVQTLKPHTSSCSHQAEGGPSNDATHN